MRASWEAAPIDGFERIRAPGRVLIVASPWIRAASELGLVEAGGLERALAGTPGPPGRGRTAIVALPGTRSQLHLRPVRHGGWFGGVLRGALFGIDRPLAELRVSAALAARGAAIPRPALIVAERVGPFWNAAVGTVFEAGTLDGGSFLAGAPEPERLGRAAAAAGRAIAGFHARGGSHRDLHVGNLLVRDGADASEVIVADLDRARLLDALTPAQRMRELMRLYRSLVKRGLIDVVGARGCSRFVSAYTGGDRELRSGMFAVLGRERVRIALHSAFYRARHRT